MIVKNPWVGYLNRSYASIKASVLARLKISAPEVSDYSESNLLITIVGIFSGMTEVLNYYIDTMAREGFLETAKRYDSVVRISRLVNYRIKSAISASVDITFTAIGSDDLPRELLAGNSITIPQGTIVSDSQGKNFVTTRVGLIGEGMNNITVPCRQQQVVPSYQIGVSSGAASQAFLLPTNYDDQTLWVSVGGVTWTLKDNFGFSGTTDKHFIVGVNTSGIPYLQFGDGTNGEKPAGGAAIRVAYRITEGPSGNLTAYSITTLVSSLTIPTQAGDDAISSVSVININPSTGGLDVESTERIRKAVPLSIRTLDRAVTLQDYSDIAKLAPSVNKAKVKFNCGKVVTIYVAPVGGGVASAQILSDVEDYVEVRKIAGLNLELKAAGETFIGLNIVATSKFRVNPSLTEIDIQRALVNAYSAENSDINKPIRTSDIIALIDNLDKVDFLDLVNIYAIPYARPSGHNLELNWERTPGEGCTMEVGVLTWKIIWNGSAFVLYKGDSQLTTLTLNVAYTYSNILTVKMLSVPGGITNGARWDFKTYPMGNDIILDDYSMPRVSPLLNYVNLTVNEQSF